MPPSGSVETVAADVVRIVAPNPSPMTASGTCTYVVGRDADAAVIDTGPADDGHAERIRAALAGRTLCAVLVSHPHLDHSAGAHAFAGGAAPVMAFGGVAAGRSAMMRRLAERDDLGGGEGTDGGFAPDVVVADGAVVAGDGWRLVALHTPGHMGPHLSFHWPDRRLCFTGDVAMGWSSTLISPPDGDVTQFFQSLDRLRSLSAAALLPGHGPVVTNPAERLAALRDHRLAREAAILDALGYADRIATLLPRVYADTPPAMHAMAARNLFAHLLRLVETGAATADRLAPDGRFRRV